VLIIKAEKGALIEACYKTNLGLDYWIIG